MPRGGSSWLVAGQRDFVLPRPSLDLGGFSRKAATSADVAWRSSHALERLRIPTRALEREGGGGWTLFGHVLLPQSMDVAWTNHSERATLVSGLAAAGGERERRDALGRWRPGGSDQYARTYVAQVRDLVGRLVRIVHDGRAYGTFDEDDACSEVERRLLRKGVAPETAEEEVAALGESPRTSRASSGRSSAPRRKWPSRLGIPRRTLPTSRRTQGVPGAHVYRWEEGPAAQGPRILACPDSVLREL